ncbi:MAG: hypothetical protein AAGA48_03420 [Myxococcota bacterium]
MWMEGGASFDASGFSSPFWCHLRCCSSGALTVLLVQYGDVDDFLYVGPILVSGAFAGAAWILRMRPPVCRIRFDDIGPLHVVDLYASGGGAMSGGIPTDYPLLVSFAPARASADDPPHVRFEVDRAAFRGVPRS